MLLEKTRKEKNVEELEEYSRSKGLGKYSRAREEENIFKTMSGWSKEYREKNKTDKKRKKGESEKPKKELQSKS